MTFQHYVFQQRLDVGILATDEAISLMRDLQSAQLDDEDRRICRTSLERRLADLEDAS